MISKLIASVLAELGSRILVWLISQRAKQEKQAADDRELDRKAAALQTALKETLDGQPATQEQKARTREAFRDLVRSGRPGEL